MGKGANFRSLEMNFRKILPPNPSFGSLLVPSLGSFICQNREVEEPNYDISTFKNYLSAFQTNLSRYVVDKKSDWSVSNIGSSPIKNNDRRTTNGQIGIIKVPLSFGWRSWNAQYHTISSFITHNLALYIIHDYITDCVHLWCSIRLYHWVLINFILCDLRFIFVRSAKRSEIWS